MDQQLTLAELNFEKSFKHFLSLGKQEQAATIVAFNRATHGIRCIEGCAGIDSGWHPNSGVLATYEVDA